MTSFELRSSLAAASIFGLRMFGMFVILPVFALYAEHLPGGDDHTLVGMALGAYGLTQALLQLPFGWLSDRWHRKSAIYLGLAIFAAGSLIAAQADTIHAVIFGRIVQGAGAVSAAVIALTADLTRDEVRTKAMAIIGITIGVTFGLSMVAGPVLSRWIGVPGIFALTGVLAVVAILAVRFAIPDPPDVRETRPAPPKFAEVLRDPQLMRLNAGIFALHALLMALFVVVPFSLRAAGLAAGEQWKLYLPVMFLAFVLMIPLVAFSERYRRQKEAFLISIAVIGLSLLVLATGSHSLLGIGVGLVIFFKAFNFLEASLPSLISRTAPAEAKGTAVGVYSSVQYLGTFIGAAAGGWLSQHYGGGSVFAFCAVLVVIWFAVATGMSIPETRTLPVPPMDESRARGLADRLRALPGVREARLVPTAGSAHLKVDRAIFDEDNAMRLIRGEA